jgi:hypothetical protein
VAKKGRAWKFVFCRVTSLALGVLLGYFHSSLPFPPPPPPPPPPLPLPPYYVTTYVATHTQRPLEVTWQQQQVLLSAVRTPPAARMAAAAD